MGLQAVILAGFFVYFLVEMTVGATDSLVRAGTLGGLILVFAIFGTVLTRAWLRRARWPRTPTILWNALLLPVAWSMHDAGQSLLALAVGVLAVAGLGAAIGVGPRDRARDDSSAVS